MGKIKLPNTYVIIAIILAICAACLLLALLAAYEHGQRRSAEHELDQMRRQMQGDAR